MKFFIISIIVAIISLVWYFDVKIYKHIETKSCEEVRKFTYWPILLNKWNKNDNLRSMKRVFDRLGYKMVDGSEEHWDIMWSLEFPFDRFPDKITNSTLDRNQKINHFPGTPRFANKLALSTSTESKYLLPAFKFPEDAKKFDKFVEEHPEARFVEKYYDNRGVRLVKKDILKDNFDAKNKFLQVFLENPLLIQGHAFDIGIYVLITSIEPLVIYRFKQECLFRFCAEPYHPFNSENTNKYVISESKKHAWEFKIFQHLGDNFNFYNVEIFKHFLATNGHDVDALWKQFDDAISSIILSKVNHIIQEIKTQCSKIKCTNENFFELFRFDFMIDDQMHAHLLEVNMSPNLTPSMEEFERNAVHYEQVVYNTLRLVGAEGFVELREDMKNSELSSSLQNIAVDIQECLKCVDSCKSLSCELCVPCMPNDFQAHLRRFYREHLRRGEFKRIFPTMTSVDETNLNSLTETTQKLAFWFESKCEIDDDWC